MTVTLRTRITCPTCQHKIGYFAVASVRINRRSMRTTGGGVILGALEAWQCPGCGTPVPRDKPLDREPYKLADEDAAKVAAYRLRKWGVEDDGVNVERVAGLKMAATKRGRHGREEEAYPAVPAVAASGPAGEDRTRGLPEVRHGRLPGGPGAGLVGRRVAVPPDGREA